MLQFASENRFGNRVRKVFVNGVDMTRWCHAFNPNTGTAFVYATDEAGQLLVCYGRAKRAAVKGRIEVLRDFDMPYDGPGAVAFSPAL